MKKYKLKLTADQGGALINLIDTVLSDDKVNETEMLVMAGLLEIKQKLVGKMFLQSDFQMSLSHVQALSLRLLSQMVEVPATTDIGSFLLTNCNAIAQKYNV